MTPNFYDRLNHGTSHYSKQLSAMKRGEQVETSFEQFELEDMNNIWQSFAEGNIDLLPRHSAVDLVKQMHWEEDNRELEGKRARKELRQEELEKRERRKSKRKHVDTSGGHYFEKM